VAIEREVGRFAQRLHDRRPDGQVRNEMAVHDVDVNHGCAAFDGTGNLLAEVGEVCREYRRR
jgi:hypothetical protein